MKARRKLKGFAIYANRKDGNGHVKVGTRLFRSRETADNEVTRLTVGRSAAGYSKPMAVAVFN